jgi:hypothetical protein
MGHINGAGREFFAWERWFLGWLDSRHVECLTFREVRTDGEQFQLSPVEDSNTAPNAKKMVVVKIGPHAAICVEFRRAMGYDARIRKQGLLVYLVDTSESTGGAIRVLPRNDMDYEKWNATLAVGESLFYKGIGVRHTSARILNMTSENKLIHVADLVIRRGSFKPGHRSQA